MKSLSLEIKENTNSKEKMVNTNHDSNFLFHTLCKAKNNNKDAILFFIEKYQPLIKKYAFKYKYKKL